MLPGPSVHGVFQAEILKWVAVSFPALTGGFFTSELAGKPCIPSPWRFFSSELSSMRECLVHMYGLSPPYIPSEINSVRIGTLLFSNLYPQDSRTVPDILGAYSIFLKGECAVRR